MAHRILVPTALLLTLAWAALAAPPPLAAQYDLPDGPGGGGGGEVGDHLVRVVDNRFEPANLTIQEGETVTWRWEGPSAAHNVVEEGGGFRCADGCDGFGGNGDPATGWQFTLEFTEAGTVDYLCEVHVALGMTGRVVVEGSDDGGGGGGGGDDGGGGGGGGGDDGGGGGGGDDGGGDDGGGDDGGGDDGPGMISFESAGAGIVEGAPRANVPVVRTGGTSGEVSVSYQTADGTATAGEDYESSSGTVTFPDGSDRGSAVVPILQDGEREGVETVELTLSDPAGGASLGAVRTATLLLFDDDEQQTALTAEEVVCDAFRLEGFLDRVSLAAPNSGQTLGVNLSFTRLGDFAGLAYTANGPTPEAQLAFSTNPEETTLLRNPARPQLFAVSLTRNQTNSDLVAVGSPDHLVLRLDPTLDSSQADPAALLSVDDVGNPVTREGGSPAESKPGRGLSDLVRVCHQRFTSRDRHVFQVLTKIVRAELPGAQTVKIGVFRGRGRDVYRLDAHFLGPDGGAMGRLAAALDLRLGPGDSLEGGTLRLLDPCTPGRSSGCTSVDGLARLQLVRPVFGDELWQDTPYFVSTGAGGQGSAEVDLESLLAGTSWQRP